MSSAAFSYLRNAVQQSSPVARQAAFLWGIDLFANAADYGYHLYLGRALSPGDFAAVQSINAALLVLITASGVLQPVMARLVAEAGAPIPAVSPQLRDRFQYYFVRALWVGVPVTALTFGWRQSLASWLNVPAPVVAAASAMGILALMRPLFGGFLQGAGRFFGFGLLRILQAVGRLVVGVLLVALGLGAAGAVAALPLGATLAVLAGLILLGPQIWQPARSHKAESAWKGSHLSMHALVAYIAFMVALNADLIWVNRVFPPETAAGYAASVLLRRAISLLPGAVVVILFPRVARLYASGRRPDGATLKALALVLGITSLATAGYAVLGGPFTRLTFGAAFEPVAARWLGWMGVAMVGYGLGTVWMNVFLASQPRPFVLLLGLIAAGQIFAYATWHTDLAQIVTIFGLSGWGLALGGALLYWFWLRPNVSTGRTRA